MFNVGDKVILDNAIIDTVESVSPMGRVKIKDHNMYFNQNGGSMSGSRHHIRHPKDKEFYKWNK